MPPLRFTPLLKRYLWGGRRLSTVLGKTLPPGDDYAESWEVADHGADQSLVAAGPLQGLTLAEVLRRYPAEILGAAAPLGKSPAHFPLLFKYLDSNRPLSVQVHPNDDAAAKLSPPDLGKTEAWYVVHAELGAVVYAGLKHGVGRRDLEAALADGTVEGCLHSFSPRAGDCLFIPAGVVHALGAGFVIAEIQQSSNTTYRLFDWNRVGADGQPRPLHIAESLDAIDFNYGPVAPQRPQWIAEPGVEQLVACDKFVLRRRTFAGQATIGGDGRFRLLTVLEGEVVVADDPLGMPLRRGETLLLSAAASGSFTSLGPSQLLEMSLPSA